mgnify:CR=1 FL=1
MHFCHGTVTNRTLILSSLRFYFRSHLGTLLGALVGCTVLTGALVVGDSVRGSLRQMALARLGNVDVALDAGDRFFRAELASALQEKGSGLSAAALQVPGTALNSDQTARANRVHVLGMDDNFWKLARAATTVPLEENAVALNEELARQLNAQAGDTVLIRVHKPSALSREAPISPQEDFSIGLRLKVTAIVDAEQLGRFSLQANQVPPFNAFVRHDFLARQLELDDKANLMLLQLPHGEMKSDPEATLRNLWQLADGELSLRDTSSGLELRSDRIFLDEPVSKAALNHFTNATGILTYFVNELRVSERTTPYSMVTAAGAPVVPADMTDDEALINQWLADDLQAKAGDTLSLRYFVMGRDNRLEERTNVFRVRAVIPMEGIHGDRELMPEFPGIAKAEKTEHWDAGFPVDMKKIRPKDEAYWEAHRGTPKAFITLAAGQKMWSNRFGNLTAVRFFENANLTKLQVESAILGKINPADVGLYFQPVREQALAASSQAQDFGGLFLGFSFFLIVAALILMSLLFQFHLEQRSPEIGTLLAVGYRPAQVRRMLLAEGAALALLGGGIGAACGIFYAKAMLRGLATIWSDAVAGSALHFFITPATVITGALASVAVSVLTIWLVLRKQARRPARELLVAETGDLQPSIAADSRRRWAEAIAVVCILSAVGLVGFAIAKELTGAAGIFFGGGALLLTGGIALAAVILKRLGAASTARQLTLTGLAVRGCTRRRKRSLATLALLASGTFLMVAVSAFRLSEGDPAQRASGTGGFALIGETTLPVVQNLNEPAGREFFALPKGPMDGVEFVAFRVREGDDASCLNLNRAQQPRLLGVNPEELARRNAFTFAGVAKGFPENEPWRLLEAARSQALLQPGEITAIGDAASIQWALGKKLGDTLDYTDERGNRFKLRLVAGVANSILQGSLIIDEAEFVKWSPGVSSSRMFLMEAPYKNIRDLSGALVSALRDTGLELTPAAQRLAAFNAVQNTYLNTFQVLGGLGLLLGSAGLGVVVLRNVLERRAELGLMQAVGFRRRVLKKLVLVEHAALLAGGLALGVLAAVVAILPEFLSVGGQPPLFLLLTLGAVFLSGLIWTWLATRFALRGELLKALRNE